MVVDGFFRYDLGTVQYCLSGFLVTLFPGKDMIRMTSGAMRAFKVVCDIFT